MAAGREKQRDSMESQALEVIVGILIVLILVAILMVIFRWLCNSTMPEVFGIRGVSFWQAVKILLPAGILIGGHRAVEVPPSMTADSGPQTTQAE
jgi:succinate dehydrogenase hydrophobic anchor subunit